MAAVLIVDDNADAADGLAMLLRMAGFEVCVAYGADEAMSLAHERLPDVALLDLGMPGRDGFELADDLKRLASSRPIRLMAVTGYHQTEFRQQAAKRGFERFFVKPPDLAKLEEAIRSPILELP